jgi:hypothetical protein
MSGCQELFNGVIFQSGLVVRIMFTGAANLAAALLSAKRRAYPDISLWFDTGILFT